MPKMDPIVADLVERTVRGALADVRFRTEFTDESVLLTGQELADLLIGKKVAGAQKPGLGKTILTMAKPTLVINSPSFGRRIWAPYGEADAKAPEMWRGKMKLWLAGGMLALVGIGFGLGRLSVRRGGGLKGFVGGRR